MFVNKETTYLLNYLDFFLWKSGSRYVMIRVGLWFRLGRGHDTARHPVGTESYPATLTVLHGDATDMP